MTTFVFDFNIGCIMYERSVSSQSITLIEHDITPFSGNLIDSMSIGVAMLMCIEVDHRILRCSMSRPPVCVLFPLSRQIRMALCAQRPF
jgi:hypothetical protein